MSPSPIRRCLSLLLLLLFSGGAQAVDYTFSTFGTSTPCTGSWSRSGSVFTCSGRVTLASGDTLSVNSIFLSDIRVVALNGFSLTNNVIGSGAGDITLESDYGSILSAGTNSIRGSVQSNSGPISLSGTTVTGSVSGNGSVSLTGGQVSGNVSGAGGVTTNGAVINGTLTASSGSVNLTGGSVGGLVRSGCCTVTSNGTNLLGGARSDSSGLQISGGTIQGDFYANNNTAAFSGVTMLSGSVTGASTATFSNSSLGTGLAPVTVTTVSGAVTLDNSVAFGTFTAPSYSTIFVTGSSTVTGTCLPNSTPANACQPSPCLNEGFSGALNSGDWAVNSRSGSFGLPRVVNGRLRLTDNSGNVSTGATIQRLVPAAGNLVQIDFKYYAYNGSGADGVAVIFSDAAVTPQPGGYGGSLGYAQLNGTSGFAGGWLGIALDEFGNFSNPTETRVGGPGLRQDSVSIRGSGSGTSGYRYLRGTAANLNPGIDVAGTTPGPGHTYRIVLDSRTSGRTLVSVLRNTGSGFVTLIAPFDAQAEAGQAALPANFLVTFTGSTGGSTNIHELDDLSFCADRIGFIGQQIDHFRFSYSGEAVTCSPQPVQISACLNADCSLRYTDPVSVTLAPASGWSAVDPASLSGNVLTFSGGTASALLRQTSVGTATLGAGSSTPATKAFSVPVCSTPGCQINYRESGLLVDVPTLTSARPETGAEVRAVRSSDNALVCTPHFANVTRTLRFTSAYRNPGTGTQPVVVNGNNVGAAAVAVPLFFGASGVARMTVRYDDAGEMRLNASYSGSAANGDSGLSMSGTDDFVVKPYGLCLQTDASCSVASASCAVFPNGVRAGDSFPLRIRAVGWQSSDTEPLTAAALCDNLSTPNFQLANIALSSAVAAPIGGDNGVVAPNTYSHVLGATTTTQASVSEVGVFTISATPGNYLGVPMSGGTSGFVGRFVPAYLGASGSASLTPACGTAFSYQGQWIGFAANREPSLTVSAYNRAGAVTRNYDRPGFWKLSEPTAGSYAAFSDTSELALHGAPAWATELAARNARLSAEAATSAVVSGAEDGDGSRTYRWPGQRLMYQATSQPTRADAPFLASVRQQFSAAQLREVDGGYEVCVGSGGGCQDFSYDFTRDPGSEIRLGRLSLGNAHGSELQGLSLPLRIESWRDGAFQLESGDNCSAPLLGDPAPVAGTYSGNLATGETAVTRSGPSAGVGQILLSAPGAGNDGSLQVQLPGLPDWLLYDWRGTGRESPRGLASFGIYQGSPPLIFRRELYR